MKLKKIMITLLIGVLSLSLVSCSLFKKEDKKDPTEVQKEPTIVEIQSDITETYKKISTGCVGVYATKGNSASIGSGVIYKKTSSGKYYVVTNEHVIDSMSTVRIFLGGSKYYKATVIGYDKKNDIAVLSFSLDILGKDGDDLYIHDIFSYDEEIVTVGQTTLAIGCPLSLDYFNTLTTGIVSKVTKGTIQTNADINPGNSGGGLFNIAGRLIGINSSKEVTTTGTSSSGVTTEIAVEGIGFAISLDVVKKCITDIEKKTGAIERPLLGMTVSNVNVFLDLPKTEDYVDILKEAGLEQGLVVIELVYEGLAREVGIRTRDIITKCNSQVLVSNVDLSYILNQSLAGDTIELEVYRSSEKKVLSFTITLR